MKLILKLALSTLAVLGLSYMLPGVDVPEFNGVKDLKTPLLVAIVLGILNTIVRPILVFFTIPVTIISLGLFLLVINGAMVIACDKLIDGFEVNGLLWAIVFASCLSVFQWILYKIFIPKKKK